MPSAGVSASSLDKSFQPPVSQTCVDLFNLTSHLCPPLTQVNVSHGDLVVEVQQAQALPLSQHTLGDRSYFGLDYHCLLHIPFHHFITCNYVIDMARGP